VSLEGCHREACEYQVDAEFLAAHKLAVRAVWLRKDEEPRSQLYNFTSFSLWIEGAIEVLGLYSDVVPSLRDQPLLLIACAQTIKEVGFPVEAFSCAQFDFASVEKEIVLPAFSRLEFVREVDGSLLCVPLSSLSGCNRENVANAIISSWSIPQHERRAYVDQLVRLPSDGLRAMQKPRESDSMTLLQLRQPPAIGNLLEANQGGDKLYLHECYVHPAQNHCIWCIQRSGLTVLTFTWRESADSVEEKQQERFDSSSDAAIATRKIISDKIAEGFLPWIFASTRAVFVRSVQGDWFPPYPNTADNEPEDDSIRSKIASLLEKKQGAAGSRKRRLGAGRVT